MVRRDRGFTMIEIVVTLALFGLFLYIIVMLTAEMKRNEAKWPVNFMTHPEVGSVVARMRRDIEDTKYFPSNVGTYQQTPQTLLLYTLLPSGFGKSIVYDCTTPGEVHRREFTGTQQTEEWVANGVPAFTFADVTMDNGQDAVHITAVDSHGKIAIDQVIVPRPHG